MNIHPLFVHFPIALLAVYAIMELIHTQRLNHSGPFSLIKGFLVIVGAFTAYLTLSTGDIAEDMLLQSRGDLNQLIETHATFAGATTVVFSVLALAYVIKFIDDSHYANTPALTVGRIAPVWRALCTSSRAIRETVFGQILALLGIICITITGGLGSAIVYGPDTEPLTHFIYRMFF